MWEGIGMKYPHCNKDIKTDKECVRMSLSNKKHRARCECKLCGERLELVYKQEDVKQFIKELKAMISTHNIAIKYPITVKRKLMEGIENLAGEDLVENNLPVTICPLNKEEYCE